MTGEHHEIYADIDRAFERIKRLESRIGDLEDKLNTKEYDLWRAEDAIKNLENKVSGLERGY